MMFEKVNPEHRHEYKYVISLEQAYETAQRLSSVLRFDSHAPANGMYRIASVYFDSPEDTALSDSENGRQMRKKFRIRSYNRDDSYISMEIKEKNRYLCHKRSCKIDRRIYDEILYGDITVLKRLQNDVADEFYCMMRCEGYKPKTVVEYDRRAFVSDISNTRITIDRNIKGSGSGFDMFTDTDSLVSVFSPAFVVLEVKYDRFLADHISALLPTEVNPRQSVSKYVFARTYK